jgi:hypothetical protein
MKPRGCNECVPLVVRYGCLKSTCSGGNTLYVCPPSSQWRDELLSKASGLLHGIHVN